jgi:ferredoxin
MKIEIIPTRCSNQRKCYRIAPEWFREDDYGFPWPESGEVPVELEEAVRKAAYACPTKAIVIDRP